MAIKLGILPHQTECIRAVARVFEDVEIRNSTNIYANPEFNIYDECLKSNINKIQRGEEEFNIIPKPWRTSVEDGTFGIDVRMETGERVIIVTGCIKTLISGVSGILNKYISCIA